MENRQNKNLVGAVFGRLRVISSAKPDSRGRKFWNCTCECGSRRRVSGYCLTSGHTKSCGCLASDLMKVAKTTHGLSYTREHKAWCNIINRCTNPNATGFKHYGGRGIKVCKRWSNFINFLTDMGRKPSPRHSIERKNNDGNYTPSNCRWATQLEQSRNRRTNVILQKGKLRMTIGEWGIKLGLDKNTIKNRLKRGIPVSKALVKNYELPND